jgi:hypothetical protein
MGILVKMDDERSELQKRITAELQEKTRKSSKPAAKSRRVELEPEDVDGVEDSAYIKDYSTSKTLNLDKTWLILIGSLVVVIVLIIVLAIAR